MDKMGVKFLFIGDLHYGPKNLDDLAVLEVEILRNIASRGPIDVIVTLGDELDQHNPHCGVRTACMNFLKKLHSLCKTMITLVGNHTRRDNRVSGGPEHALAMIDADETFIMVEDPKCIEVCGLKIAAFPYCNPPDFASRLEMLMSEDEMVVNPSDVAAFANAALKQAVPLDGYDFAIGHQEFKGIELQPGRMSECEAYWSSEFPPFISGHIHGRTAMGNILYPGTPLQHTVGESTDKYIYFAEIEQGMNARGHQWIYNGSGYECGPLKLIQIKMCDPPIRQKMSCTIEQLDSVCQYIWNDTLSRRNAGLPENYYQVEFSYHAPEQMNASQGYNFVRTNAKRVQFKPNLIVAETHAQIDVNSERSIAPEERTFKDFLLHHIPEDCKHIIINVAMMLESSVPAK